MPVLTLLEERLSPSEQQKSVLFLPHWRTIDIVETAMVTVVRPRRPKVTGSSSILTVQPKQHFNTSTYCMLARIEEGSTMLLKFLGQVLFLLHLIIAGLHIRCSTTMHLMTGLVHFTERLI